MMMLNHKMLRQNWQEGMNRSTSDIKKLKTCRLKNIRALRSGSPLAESCLFLLLVSVVVVVAVVISWRCFYTYKQISCTLDKFKT